MSSTNTTATKPARKKAATKTAATAVKITPEQAMDAIREFAAANGNGWRDTLRTLWAGDGDGSALYAARTQVPAALLDNLSFKPARQPKPLTPEQETARRLRVAGKAMRARAKALQTRAKEVNALARRLRQKDAEADVEALMRELTVDGQLAELEAEAAQ